MIQRSLLFIVEQGGYPLFEKELMAAGYNITTATSMRKALALLKSLKPDVILAEFNFAPKYGDRISNLEPLLAQVQSTVPNAKVVVFLEPEYAHHLERLRAHFSISDAVCYPLQWKVLEESLNRLSVGAEASR